tara:strand:- start:1009 stop:2190 length:1182 start_codon:yes stop_codon:yes gene_type:complete
MKTLLFIQMFGIAFLLSACTGANYYLKKGNYDASINFSVQKLRKNPKKADKHILALESAWNIERSLLLDRIEFLKLDGSPDSWVEIHALYEEMDVYQRLIKPILPLFIKKEFRNADIELINVNEALIDAKQKAAAYMYAKGEELLVKNTKLSAREAYAHFQKVKNYYGSYKDVDTRIDEAYAQGQNHILLRYSNSSQLIIPQQFMDNLAQFDEQALDAIWTKYHLDHQAKSSFDYFIDIVVFQVNIGPEQVNNSSYIDKKTVQDGFEYVLDANGNVAKDSLGNDITEAKYKEIAATVYKTEQTKVGILDGEVSYMRANGNVFQSFPFQENLVFKNHFATFQGIRAALSKESKTIIGGQGLPFPSDIQMVMDASEIIKNKTFYLIKNNQGLVYN